MADTQPGSLTPAPAPGAGAEPGSGPWSGLRNESAALVEDASEATAAQSFDVSRATGVTPLVMISTRISALLLWVFPAWTFIVGGTILVRRRRLHTRQEQTP